MSDCDRNFRLVLSEYLSTNAIGWESQDSLSLAASRLNDFRAELMDPHCREIATTELKN